MTNPQPIRRTIRLNARIRIQLLISILTMMAILPGNLYAQTASSPAEDLYVLTANPRRMLPDALHQQALALLREREQRIARIATRDEIIARQRYIRERFLNAIGGLPERTPLNPQVTGALKRDGYRIEKR